MVRDATVLMNTNQLSSIHPNTDMSTSCPWCQAPRDSGPTCPRCGANYAKAEAIKRNGRAAATVQVPLPGLEIGDLTKPVSNDTASDELTSVDDRQLELKFCASAIPVMLSVALMFHTVEFGRFLQRTFLTMPVHELGHAVTAWLCGFLAFPTLWFTAVAEERGWMMPLILFGGMAYSLHRARKAAIEGLALPVGAILVLQAIGTLGIKEDTARALIAFGGDGMGMILTTLLMASFFFGKNTQVYKGALRWGFLAIGAAAFVDIYTTWWSAHGDLSTIPFGAFENGMRSDSLVLVEDFGWSDAALANRYFWLGIACLIALVTVYGWGLRQAWQQAQIKRR